MDDFCSTTVMDIAAAVRAGETSAVEQTRRALEVIDAKNDQINAFVAVEPDRALAEAADIDARLAAGEEVGALAGVPLGVKDLDDAIGYRTTFGSRVHADDPPKTADSVIVERLRAAGCVVLGKTNTPEFGSAGDTFNDVFGVTRNPHNPDRSAGGSSGGSGAAIAAGMVPLATGSDGGGSIRIPAALNGLSGFKPSIGRVPIGGPEVSAWLNYSTPGPMARTAREIAYALDVCAGPDPTDQYSLPRSRGDGWYDALADPAPPRAVLWSPNLGFGTNDAEIDSLLAAAIAKIADAGVEVIEVDVFDGDPIREWASLAYLGLAAMTRSLEGTDRFELLSDPVKRGIRFAAKLDRFSLYDALSAGHRLNYRLAELFHRAPILLCPTAAGKPGTPGELGTVNGEPTQSWLLYTPPFNMTGNPAGTVSAATDSDGIPVGLQVVGPQHADVAVLRTMAAFEQILG